MKLLINLGVWAARASAWSTDLAPCQIEYRPPLCWHRHPARNDFSRDFRPLRQPSARAREFFPEGNGAATINGGARATMVLRRSCRETAENR